MFICELLKSCNVRFQIACLTYCNRDVAAPLTPNPFPQMRAFYKCWQQLKVCCSGLLTSFSFTESIIIGFPGGSDGKTSACNVETWVRCLGQEDPLKKDMAAQSSSLAWRNPWTEEPGMLQTTGLQRVRHD